MTNSGTSRVGIERMAYQARQFVTAAERCGGRDTIGSDIDSWLPNAQVVNYALGVELAFKGLQALHLGKAERGHDLSKLYLKLPPAVQVLLREDMNETLFKGRLYSLRLAFEEWRYAHENPGDMTISIGLLKRLAISSTGVLDAGLKSQPTVQG